MHIGLLLTLPADVGIRSIALNPLKYAGEILSDDSTLSLRLFVERINGRLLLFFSGKTCNLSRRIK